ncbi:MAG: hypothetical protein D6762_01540, partial [Candidatus Neomarinimicrobiota bacterium]
MIWPFLQRRWWLTQNRLITTIGFSLALPVFLHVIINLVLKNIIVRSIRQIPYETWVAPGLLFLLATITLIPIVYREFFDLRIHHKGLPPISISPVSKLNVIFASILTAMVESTFFVLVGVFVFYSLGTVHFTLLQLLIILVYILVLNFLNANVLVFLSLLTERVTIYVMLILSMLLLLVFGSGLVVELEFYPVIIGKIMNWLPTSALMRGIRMVLFAHIFDWILVVYPLLLAVGVM